MFCLNLFLIAFCGFVKVHKIYSFWGGHIKPYIYRLSQEECAKLERVRRGRPRKGWKEEVERDLQVLGVRRWRELVAVRKKMEGHCLTGQSPQWAVVPMDEEEEDEEESAAGSE